MKIAYFYIENPSFIYRIPALRLRISAEAPLIFWLAPALFTIALISRSLLRVKNRNIRPLLILLLFAITYLYIQTAFYADDNQNRLLRVGLFIIPTFIALFVQRQKFDHKISDIFLVSWFSLFFLLLLYGEQRFTKTALAINLFAIVYFSFDMIRLVWAKQEEQ